MLITIGLFLVYLAISGWMLRPVFHFLQQHGMTAPNYQGEVIPCAMGFYLWLVYLIYVFISSVASWFQLAWPGALFHSAGETSGLTNAAFFAAVTAVFTAGWIDDSRGNKRVKGFKGHFGALRRGIFTSGMLKVLVTGIAAVWLVSRLPSDFLGKIVAVLLIVMMTNLMNLLDLRPGRALKVFLALILLFIAAGVSLFWIGCLLPLIYGALWLLPSDLKAQAMLGDAGANMLGFAAGSALAWSAPFWLNASVVLVLGWLHWVAERRSFSHIIANNRWLGWLDRLGRT